MIDTLLEIPSHVRVRLANALESGLLAPPCTAMAIRATVGGGYDEPILHVLQGWERLGVSPVAGAAWLKSLRLAEARTSPPDFVWTGPEVAGLHARDTRRVSAAVPATRRVALPASEDYGACTMSTQYTIRAVPDAVDRAVRQRARRESKSLNTVVVEAIARGLELDARPAVNTDLDDLIGTWQEDPEFDRAVAAFERIDEEAWK